jgi:chromosome transmission fidelity protein 1
MDSVYYALENNKIAIIESPTGTGKSLSLICATTQWLKHFKTNRFNDLTKQLSKLNNEIKTIETETQLSSDWISLQNKKSILCQKRDLSIKELDKIQIFNKRNDSLIDRKNNTFMRKKFALSHKSLTKKLKTENDLNNDLTSDDNQLDEDLVNYCSDEEVIDETNETKEEDKMVRPKIYYCSRTHSQLSQFISEIKKTSFASEETPLRTVPLGSRINLCVNPNVIKLNNINLINEKCIELQNSKNKCQMHKQGFINELKDEVLTDVQDIEEITQLGKRVKACPYYSTRLAIPEAEIVILPYNILLHSGTRQSFGIDLKESIVIIDEAHNLIETINNIHSIEIKGSHIIDSQTQLNQYLTKYYSRLSPKNIMHIKQIIYILNEFIKHLKVSLNDKTNDNTSHVYEGLNFLIKLGIENLNLFKILDFCEKSRIARKLYGFNEKQKRFQVENNSENSSKKLLSGTTAFLAKMKGKTIEIESNPSNSSNDEDIQTYGSPLYLIKEFLRALINTNTSGRIITHIDKNSMRKCSLKYILLNPGSHFKVKLNVK